MSRAYARLPDRIVELVVGYDAAIVARSVLYGRADLSMRTVFLALARNVPDPRGSSAIVANPYRTWYQIDAALPDYIAVIGPELDSPAVRALAELVLQPGCAAVPALAELVRSDLDRGGELCRRIREDGVYTEYETPAVAVRRLETDPALFGVFRGDDFMRNRDKLAAAALDGVAPSLETMANGTYSASRTLYIYASRSGGTPGRLQLVETYMQLPEIARVLVAPDEATRREMRSRTGFIPRTGYPGEIR